MPLTILSASAGSGKTYRITREFVKLSLQDSNPEYASSILAMTFTNKATTEMKSRILELLQSLAKGTEKIEGETDPLVPLQNELGDAVLADRAGKLLKYLLKHYHFFSVSTIDSFFQQLIRQFRRELKLDQPYSVELNSEMVLEESIKRMLSKLQKDDPATDWLVKWLEDRQNDGSNWDFRYELGSLGYELFKEGVTDSWPDTDTKELEALFRDMRKFTTSVEEAFAENQSNLQDVLNTHGLEPDDFKYKRGGFVGVWLYSKGMVPLKDKKRFMDLDEDVNQWFTASSTSAETRHRITSAQDEINSLRAVVLSMFENYLETYKSYVAVLRNFRSYVALRFLYENLKAWCRENDVMLIHESNKMVAKVIENSDVSLLYEKSGQRYGHIMIDEFQDTAASQWQSMKPLVVNSLSEGKDSFIVGDIKQAIYRWRSGDWQLMHSKVKEDLNDFAAVLKKEALDSNWRSADAIVQFNSQFFPKAVDIITHQFLAEMSDEPLVKSIAEVYTDVAQNTGKPLDLPGAVEIAMFEKQKRNSFSNAEDENEQYAEINSWLYSTLERLYAANYRAGQIAILVRGKKEASILMEWFDQWSALFDDNSNFNAVSDNGYLLRNNHVIQLLINAMSYRLNPKNKALIPQLLYGWEMIKNQKEGSLKFTEGNPRTLPPELNIITQSSMMSLTAWFSQLMSHWSLSETAPAFLAAFLDEVRAFELKKGNDPNDFLHWWNMTGQNSGIPPSSGENAVQILTIHKSKGLQFPVVILPFINSDIVSTRNRSTIYVSANNEKMLSKLGKIPVTFSKPLLTDSLFYTDFKKEYIMQAIDSLNLLYVATTRAEQRLYIALEYDPSEKDLKMGDLLKNAVPPPTHPNTEHYLYGHQALEKWPEKEKNPKRNQSSWIRFSIEKSL
jgi:ATP-dependent helicase/nuclease subunit A